MDGAALQLLSSLRGEGSEDRARGEDGIEPLEAFACLVLGRPPRSLDGELLRLVEDAARIARRHVARERDALPPILVRAHPFREVYRAVRPLAGALSSPYASPRGPRKVSALAVEVMLRLRHRQRAALALRTVLGFGDHEVAYVLDVSTEEARRIVDAGVAGVRRLVGAPVDLRSALTSAASEPRRAPRVLESTQDFELRGDPA